MSDGTFVLIDNTSTWEECPWCHKTDRLAFSLHQCRGTRYGRYDGAIYCKRCGAYGPTVKSETITTSRCDFRNEQPTDTFRMRMMEAAIKIWNRNHGQEEMIL